MYDKEAFEKSSEPNKKQEDFFLDEFIPMTKEAVDKYFPGTSDVIFAHKDELKNIPKVLITKIYRPLYKGVETMQMGYDEETKSYKQVWAAQSKVIPSVSNPLNVISKIPTIKPGIQDLLKILNNPKDNSIQFDSIVKYKYLQKVLLPGNLEYVIVKAKPTEIWVSPDTEAVTESNQISIINRINTRSAIVKEVFNTVKKAIIEDALSKLPKGKRTKIRTEELINSQTEDWIKRQINDMHLNSKSPEMITDKLINDLIYGKVCNQT